jgi:hypothetical protein
MKVTKIDDKSMKKSIASKILDSISQSKKINNFNKDEILKSILDDTMYAINYNYSYSAFITYKEEKDMLRISYIGVMDGVSLRNKLGSGLLNAIKIIAKKLNKRIICVTLSHTIAIDGAKRFFKQNDFILVDTILGLENEFLVFVYNV